MQEIRTAQQNGTFEPIAEELEAERVFPVKKSSPSFFPLTFPASLRPSVRLDRNTQIIFFDKFSFEIANKRGNHMWVITHLYLVLVWHKTSTSAGQNNNNAPCTDQHKNVMNMLLHCHIHKHSLFGTVKCVLLCCAPTSTYRHFSLLLSLNRQNGTWTILMAVAEVDEMVLLLLTVLMTEDTNPSILSMQVFALIKWRDHCCDYSFSLQYIWMHKCWCSGDSLRQTKGCLLS